MYFVGDFSLEIKLFYEPRMDMDMDSSVNANDKEQLQAEETGDSCRGDFTEIVPLTRDTDGSCPTECVSRDWSAEVKQENLAVVKQELDDVCHVMCLILSFSQVYISKYCAELHILGKRSRF